MRKSNTHKHIELKRSKVKQLVNYLILRKLVEEYGQRVMIRDQKFLRTKKRKRKETVRIMNVVVLEVDTLV